MDKLYGIGLFIIAISIVTALAFWASLNLSTHNGSRFGWLRSASEFLLELGVLFFALGVAFEISAGVRKIWRTTIGKIVLGAFSGVCVFTADLLGRMLIYKMTGENPDAFSSARPALIWLLTPLLWILGLYLSAFLSTTAYFSLLFAACMGLILFYPIQFLINSKPARLLFGHRSIWRLRRWKDLPFSLSKAFCRLVGLIGACIITRWFLGNAETVFDQAEPMLQTLVVQTSFNNVPPGRYGALKYGSLIAFLPGDRICIAEPLPKGKYSFRTVQRADLK